MDVGRLRHQRALVFVDQPYFVRGDVQPSSVVCDGFGFNPVGFGNLDDGPQFFSLEIIHRAAQPHRGSFEVSAIETGIHADANLRNDGLHCFDNALVRQIGVHDSVVDDFRELFAPPLDGCFVKVPKVIRNFRIGDGLRIGGVSGGCGGRRCRRHKEAGHAEVETEQQQQEAQVYRAF